MKVLENSNHCQVTDVTLKYQLRGGGSCRIYMQRGGIIRIPGTMVDGYSVQKELGWIGFPNY